MTKNICIDFMDMPVGVVPDTEDFETDKAYIKQESVNNELVWSIYNCHGEKMGYAASREVAFAIVNQNELIGLSVH